MPVPKQRHTKSRRNRRRSHHALKPLVFAFCAKCKRPALPHTVCMNCGTYRGREFVDVLAKLSKRERKTKEREIARQEKEAAKEEKEAAPSTKPLSLEELSRK